MECVGGSGGHASGQPPVRLDDIRRKTILGNLTGEYHVAAGRIQKRTGQIPKSYFGAAQPQIDSAALILEGIASPQMSEQTSDSADEWYTKRLQDMDSIDTLAKRLHTAMYSRHIRRLATDRVLDVGCGIGMNLRFLSPESVGTDHNKFSVAVANEAGLRAYTPDELHARAEEFNGAFDTMLCAHIMEHLDFETGLDVLEQYLPYLKPKARIVLLTPQDPECKNDPTHVRYVDLPASRELAEKVGFTVERSFGFPLPPSLGKYRTTNEFVVVAGRS